MENKKPDQDINLKKKEKRIILNYLKNFAKKKNFKFLLRFNYNATQKNKIVKYFASNYLAFNQKKK